MGIFCRVVTWPAGLEASEFARVRRKVFLPSNFAPLACGLAASCDIRASTGQEREAHHRWNGTCATVMIDQGGMFVKRRNGRRLQF
jgi:hypothetical protein